MKPKNFPGRKNLRRYRARNLVLGDFQAKYISDIRFRVGRKHRNVFGIPI